MALGRKATVTTMSVMPWRRSNDTMCSIIGRPTSGSIGLGRFEVCGRRRVPSPPAMITAFIRRSLAPSCGSPGPSYDAPPGGAPRPQGVPGRGDIAGRGGPGQGQTDDAADPGDDADRP